jgi:hypothetical protein
LKKAAIALALLALALSLAADVRTGLVQGRVVDKTGKPVAGVKVTLVRPQAADQTAVTDASGLFRFPAVFPGSDYSVKAVHPDYKTTVRTHVVVPMGGRVSFDVPLELGKPEEAVNVTAPTPAIDPTRFASGTAFGWTELQTLPTARNPWVVLQLAPSVALDREDVGGSEATAQSAFITRGDYTNGATDTWTVDGVDIGDPVDLGRSAIRTDLDTIDTMTVTTGGAADVTQQTSGIAVNILKRRGGNALSGTAHVYLTDHAFQGSNITSTLRSEGVANTNRIQHIRDFGASAGGPVFKDHLWLWGAYGVQDIFNYTIYDTPDRAQFGNYDFKLDAEPFKGNRAEALFAAGSDERFGVDAAIAKPEGDHRTGRFSLGSPVFKLQDEQVLGSSFSISAKVTWVNAGTTQRPTVDENLTSPVVFDIAEGLYVPFSSDFGRSWERRQDIRAQKGLEITATLFKDHVLGMSHEIKAGLAFSDKKVTTTSGFAQNYEVFRDFTEPLIDLGEGLVVPPADWQRFVLNREDRRVDLLGQSSGFLQDTIVAGRFALRLGLRYDHQRPTTGAYSLSTVLSSWSDIFSSDSMTYLNTYFPPLSVSAVDSKYRWGTWSPRVALSWDLKGDGRTILKLAMAQYGDLLTPGANAIAPLGLAGRFNFWWNDADADSMVDLTEIDWIHAATYADAPNQLYALFESTGTLTEDAADALDGGFESDAYRAGNFSGFDWSNRDAVNYDNVTTFYRSDVEANARNVKTSPRTREISLSLEKELRPDLTASIAATFRRYDNFDWAKLFYPADVYPSTPDLVIDDTTGPWYAEAGTIPQTITYTNSADDEVTIDLGEAGGKPWYLPVASFPGPTPYRMVDKSRSYRTYFGLDLGVTKRLSDRWFMNASLTLQDQRYHLRDSYVDPTNVWAIDGQAYGNPGGAASGQVPALMYSRWLLKISALYQIPWGIDVAATLHAREGWAIPHYITLAYADAENWPGLYQSNLVYLQPPTKDHLPALKDLNFRIEKSFAFGAGRLVLMADVFNVLNSATVIRATDAYYGTYYVDTNEFVPNVYNRAFNEILNPRVWRFGVRFEF